MRSITVTAPEVQNLRCPFTGRKLVVQMHVNPGSVTFSAPDAFSLKAPRKCLNDLLDDASQRNGVFGAVARDSAWVDPYTGERFQLRELPDGSVFFTGGFNPRMACKTLGEFIYRATMRDGHTDMEPPAGLVAEKPTGTRTPSAVDTTPDDAVMEAADRAVHAAVDSGRLNVTTTTVHMSGKKKGGK